MRLLPIALLTYFLCYVDRINVGFAALTMRGDLHMSAADFGFAAGTFYWGYFIFEVPSNIILEKVGARLWIARIMITWGLLAAVTAFATGVESFAIIRFFLGAGGSRLLPRPDPVFHLLVSALSPRPDHLRLPDRPADRGRRRCADFHRDPRRSTAGWACAAGSTCIYWRRIPTVLIGIVVLFVLTDRPEQAKFLTDRGKSLAGRTSWRRNARPRTQ